MGWLAALPVIGLLVAVSLGRSAVPWASATTVTAAPATAAHPPTRDYDVDLPPLIPADSPITSPDPAVRSDQTGPPMSDGGGTGSATSPDASDAATAPGAVTLTAAERRVPVQVLAAYRAAARRAETQWPDCHLRWQVLAGIGRIESGHGVGRAITADGTITRPILGPALDGRDGRALVRDTDAGRLDGDRRLDRAVGPMQFIPTTWVWAGRDGSGDGRADPNNVDDAALAAAGYLCGHHRDLAEPAGLRAALLSYNPSTSYVRAVLAWTAAYTDIGPLPGPALTTPTTSETAAPAVVAPPPPPPPAPAPPAPSGQPVAPSVAPTPAGPSSPPGASADGSPTPDPGAVPAPSPTRSPAPPAATRHATTPAASPVDGLGSEAVRASPSREDTPTVSPSDALLVVPLTPARSPRSPRAPNSTP